MTSGRARLLIVNSALFFGSAITAILSIELFLAFFFPQPLRKPLFAYDPELGQIPTPNQTSQRTQPEDPPYTTCNDSNGFRCILDQPRSPEKTILFLGDSFTYGSGVSDHETFSAVIQKFFNDKRKSIKVINAGNPGVGTDYALKFLTTKLKSINPNTVVIGFYPNDYMDNGGNRYYELINKSLIKEKNIRETFAYFKNKETLTKNRIYIKLCEYSHLTSLMRRLFAARALAGGIGNLSDFIRGRPNTAGLKSFSDQSSTEETNLYIREIAKFLKENHIEYWLLYFPTQNDIETYRSNGRRSIDETNFMRIAQNTQSDVRSLTPELAQINGYLNEGHWNPIGHQVIAKAICELFFHQTKSE